MNTNTLKAALTKFTGKKFALISHAEYKAAADRAPAIIQDSMDVGEVGFIVTRAYGAGEEVYAVEDDSLSVQYFKQV